MKKQSGVTLAELMMVLVMVAIVAAIAIPTYNNIIQRSRRSDAREALSDLAARQEQFFNNNKVYASSASELGTEATSQNNYYSIQITTTNSGMEYVLLAVPQGAQSKDTDCDDMTLTSAGAKTPSDCW